MFDRFYPDSWIDSAYNIDYEQLRNNGIKGLVFDIDNTLVKHGAPADIHAVELIKKLEKMEFGICLLSNNKEPRVAGFADEIGVKYVFKANKPSRTGYRRAMKELGTDEKNTVAIGDQLFTDIYGAKRAGIYSILVNPIGKQEEIQIVLKRYLERIVLFFYKKKMSHINKTGA